MMMKRNAQIPDFIEGTEKNDWPINGVKLDK